MKHLVEVQVRKPCASLLRCLSQHLPYDGFSASKPVPCKVQKKSEILSRLAASSCFCCLPCVWWSPSITCALSKI